ncbi:MAG: energy-coupling factor ABC transporter permease [Thiobacillaceae bacterium]|nr:energy-coupling factor ABC transporter permease [Thiobacillaceae bacterium]MCX7672416.1 energy-coupling factor ABC transporter permease [Thiobacillaceae bacterium]MDW8323628.1 energy-coupling factor ABC transporter permease [Burkholderiales bacterium]
MNLISDHLPPVFALALWFALAAGAWWHVRTCRWRMLRDRDNLNVFLGATVAVLALWLIRTGIKPGLSFHLLGATVLTLMFRPAFALLALALVTAALAVWDGQYLAYPANLLVTGVVPVAVSWAIYRLADRRLPNHLFIYIFVNAFFGAAIAIGAVGLASTGLAAVLGVYGLDYLMREYLPYYLLMAWSEAFVTGMVMTLLVVYRPQWVATFDDRRYLQR